MQVTPDGDYTRTGVEWNKVGYTSPTHKQYVTAPERSGLYYFHASTPSGRQLRLPLGRRPGEADARPSPCWPSNITWNAYNNFGGRSNYINADRLPADADRQLAAGADALHRRRVTTPGATRLRRRCRSTGPSRSTTSDWTRRSPTRSRAGRPATSPRRSGGCSAGWSARASPTTSTPRRSSHDGVLDLSRVPGPDAERPPRVLDAARCTIASSGGSSRRAAG